MKQRHLIETAPVLSFLDDVTLASVYRTSGMAFLDDVTLASVGGESLHFRDIDTAKLTLPAVPIDMHEWPHTVSVDGSRRAGIGKDKNLCIIEGETGIELVRLRVVPRPCAFALSNGGEYLALSAEAGLIELFDATSGARVAEFRHTADELDVALAFTPDGARLLSGGNDTTVLVWDVRAALRGRATAVVPLDAAKRREHWAALGSRKPAAVRAALLALRADSQSTLRLADAEFRPEQSAAEAKRVLRLIADLDADSFPVRESAGKELAAVGEPARSALVKAAREGGSAEVKKRATALLLLLGEAGLTESQLRALRAVRLLERIGGAPARRLLERLAEGSVHDPVTRAAVSSLRRQKTMTNDGRP